LIKEIVVTDNLQPAPADSSNKSSVKNSVAKDSAKPSSALAIFALLLVVIALIAIGGIGWKGFEFSKQLLTLSHQLEQSTEKNTVLIAQLKKTDAQAKLQGQQLQQNAQRLAQLPGADRSDWLLAEAEYLLRLANQRLDLEKDWQGSVAILVAADKVLAETQNPLINPVRQLLAKELQTLRAVPAVDLTGAVARLQAVQDQIGKLEWMPRTLPKAAVIIPAVVDPEIELTAWDKFATKAWAGIEKVVRIREHDKALPAPLTPDQHYYLQQNMQLMLEQAQVALVRQQDVLYKQSIERTLAWLDEFVIVKNVKTEAVVKTLTELKSWSVSPAFPEISGSLNRLRQLQDEQRRLGSVSSSAMTK